MRRAAAGLGLAAALFVSGCSAARFYLHFTPYYLAGPGPRAECGEGPGFRYCLNHPPKSIKEDPATVLYFLHYAEGDERSWSRVPISRVFYAEFKRRGLPAPAVASVSFGPYWTLFDAPGPHSPGRFNPFVEEVMPWLEARLGHPTRRLVWGMSQGGLNASLLVLKRPELWSGAAFSCPAWYTADLFGDDAAIKAYAAGHGSKPARVAWGMSLVRERVAGPVEWAREDPLVRARSAAGLPPVYIDCTRQDDFGFFDGARLMAETLRGRGQSVVFREGSGKHCQLDAKAAASFLADVVSEGRAQRPAALDAGTGRSLSR